MTTVIAAGVLAARAETASKLLAPYPPGLAEPWQRLIATLLRCAERAPEKADWVGWLEALIDLITDGLVQPSAKIVQEPLFHVLFAEYVEQIQHGAALARYPGIAEPLAACRAAKEAYRMSGDVLPYLHAILALRAREWELAAADVTWLGVQQ